MSAADRHDCHVHLEADHARSFPHLLAARAGVALLWQSNLDATSVTAVKVDVPGAVIAGKSGAAMGLAMLVMRRAFLSHCSAGAVAAAALVIARKAV